MYVRAYVRSYVRMYVCAYVRTPCMYVPHHLLKGALEDIVDFCFKGGNSNGVYVANGKAFWRIPKRGEFRTYTQKKV